jgi:site-specific recombinase XerD
MSRLTDNLQLHKIPLPKVGRFQPVLFKRTDVRKSSWWVRVYLADEGKYWSKSTREDALEAARAKAIDLVMEHVFAPKATGHFAVSPPLGSVVSEYLSYLSTEKMSQHTRDNLKRRLGLCMQFLLSRQGEITGAQAAIHDSITLWFKRALEKENGTSPVSTLKLKDVDGHAFMDYLEWRLKSNPNLRHDTVAMELGTIKRMFKWAKTKNLCGESSIPVWDFKLEKDSAKRKRLDSDEADRVLAMAKAWSEQPTTTEREAYGRHMLYYVMAVMAGTGMRTGEVLGLKNRNVKPTAVNECKVTIDKTKANPRAIPVNGTPCMLLEWISKHQIHKDPDDYVFSRHKSGTEFAEGALHKTGDKFKKEILKPAKLDFVTPYHQRHHFVSECLRAGGNIIDVAAYCGTSPRVISKTYSHITGEDAGVRVLNKLRDWQSGTSTTN